MNTTVVRNISKVSISALTDTGRIRPHNEDNFIVCSDLDKNLWVLKEGWIELSKAGCLLVLADGMGGANAGEIASSIAVESIKEHFSSLPQPVPEQDTDRKEIILKAISISHERIVAKAKSDPMFEGMGTTIVVAWAIQGKIYVCWCGDSRAYKCNATDGLKQITKDHSLVWELVEAGKLTPDEADVHPDNNIITQSLGDTGSMPKPGITTENLESGDVILLCSDGLNNMVNSESIEKTLRGSYPLTEMSKQLIKQANEQGGKDNVTVILLRLSAPGSVGGSARKRSENRLAVVIPILIALFILGLISLNRDKGIVGSHYDSLTVKSERRDSVRSTNQPRRAITPKAKGAVPSSGPKKAKKLTSSIPVSGEVHEDTLGLIAASMIELQSIRHQWDGLKRTADSLRTKEVKGAGMITVNTQVTQFERLLTVEKPERFLSEWKNFKQDSSKGLSNKFSVSDLVRKTDTLRTNLAMLDEALRNAKLQSEVQ